MSRRAMERNEKKGVTISEKEREEAKVRRNKLVNPSYDEVEAALKAVKICDGCNDKGEIKRKNAEGQCVLCGGKGLVRDKDERKWAAVFVLERADPAPKSVEMVVEDKRDREKLIEEVSQKSDAEVDALLEQMGVSVKGEDGTSPQQG
jgi:hypothetical protein